MAYPERLNQIRTLVEDHKRFADEPLHLAIYYRNTGRPDADCLMEVYTGFGFADVDPDKRMLAVEYGGSEGFPLPPNHWLRLIITNPAECETALREQWPQIEPFAEALRQGLGNYKIIYRSKLAKSDKLLERLYDSACDLVV